MASFLGTVSYSSYPLVLGIIVILTAWSVFHVWTRGHEDPHLTEVHMTLSTVLMGGLLVQLSSVMHKNGR